MTNQPPVFEVNATIQDSRIRAFQRIIAIPGSTTTMPVDNYVIVTQRFVVICDTFICPNDMATLLHAIQDDLPGRQLLVINSHADWDHAWGNCYFTGTQTAPIIAHEHTLARLQSPEAQQTLRRFQQHNALFQSVTLMPPTLTFSSTLTIQGGDLTLQIFAAPGHSVDHCALWIPELHLLLAFDAIEEPMPALEGVQGVPAMLATLEHFQALHPHTVLCSHSAASPQTITEHLSYFHEIERRSRDFLTGRNQPLTTEEITKAATLLQFPFSRAIEGMSGTLPEDTAFFREAHEQNVGFVLQWVSNSTAQDKNAS
jgi:glyoxylase-like metal-dependent hydrolase (beta-lactamase superfamily II)